MTTIQWRQNDYDQPIISNPQITSGATGNNNLTFTPTANSSCFNDCVTAYSGTLPVSSASPQKVTGGSTQTNTNGLTNTSGTASNYRMYFLVKKSGDSLANGGGGTLGTGTTLVTNTWYYGTLTKSGSCTWSIGNLTFGGLTCETIYNIFAVMAYPHETNASVIGQINTVTAITASGTTASGTNGIYSGYKKLSYYEAAPNGPASTPNNTGYTSVMTDACDGSGPLNVRKIPDLPSINIVDVNDSDGWNNNFPMMLMGIVLIILLYYLITKKC